MNPNLALPIAIALIAFFVLYESSDATQRIVEAEYSWQNGDSIRKRLREIGKAEEVDYQNFRIAQMSLVLTTLTILLAGLFFNLLSLQTFLALAVLGSTSIVLLSERQLSSRVKKLRRAIDSEFPAVIEILMLAITAGESPAAAFRRVSHRSAGVLSLKLKSLVSEVENGTSFAAALDLLSKEVHSEQVRRFADAVIIATSRGTSLAETFRHAVEDARSNQRAKLITAAGKAEISMLIPIVFLILPISIGFALFPSLMNLNLFA